MGDGLNRKESSKLFMAHQAATADPLAMSLEGAADGLERLHLAVWDR